MTSIDPIDKKYFRYAVSEVGKDTEVDIQARCTICGDSETDGKQKRLHLYVKPQYDNSICHCFNCGWKGNMFQFLQETNVPLYEEYKKEKRETSFNNLKRKKETNNVDDFRLPIIRTGFESRADDNIREEHTSANDDGPKDPVGVPTDPLEKLKGKKLPPEVFELPEEFYPASDSLKGSEYLKGRKLDPENYYFSKSWIKLNGKDIPVKNCIIIPLWVNKAEKIVYGFQARSIESKFFYTYIPPENSGYKAWNWYNIDRTKPTFIFESVFDAESSGLPSDRISAALGSDLIEERADELMEAIYCFDNQRFDYTSKVKSIELLRKGARVFVWPIEIHEKDTNDYIRASEGNTRQSLAKIILTNIESGMNGIMRIKLLK